MDYKTTASSTPYPHDAYNDNAPPPYTEPATSPSTPRLLHIYHQGLTHRTTQVLGPDKTTVLYTVKTSSCCLFGSKPHVTVSDGAGNPVGTVTFHCLSRKIDLVIHDTPVVFAPSGHFTSAHEWSSLAATGGGVEKEEEKGGGGGGGGGGRFTWKSDKWHGLDLVCKDERGEVCARFDASTWAVHKEGKFEMGPAVGGALMDELVVTGFAMLELRKRNATAASA